MDGYDSKHARHSNGVYGSTPSSASNASLRGHAAAPSGVATTTPAGVPVGVSSAAPVHAMNDHTDSNPLPPPTPLRKPFYKRPSMIVQIITSVIGFIMIWILLWPVCRAVIQTTVNRATLDIQIATVSDLTNNSFTLSIFGNVAHTGGVHATVKFTQPVTVAWVYNKTSAPLGTITLAPFKSRHFRAPINQTTTFHITNETAFAQFAQYLITSPNFTWHLQSHNLRVNAAKFPVARHINFNKFVTVNGLNGLNGYVALKDVQLPSDNAAAGGVNFTAVTELTNLSPFNLDLGTVVFQLTYQDVFLGLGTGKNVRLVTGVNSVSFSGYLVQHNDPHELAVLSTLFNNYVNGDESPVLATGHSMFQDDGSSISWLSYGFQGLQLTIPFKPLNAINPTRIRK